MSNEYITGKVKAIIGAQTDWVTSTPSCRSQRSAPLSSRDHGRRAPLLGRRLGGAEAVMVGWSPRRGFRFMRFVAGPPASTDPAGDDMNKPDYDGLSSSFSGLPAVEVELPRDLNGGYEYEVYRYARVGEKVLRRAATRTSCSATARVD